MSTRTEVVRIARAEQGYQRKPSRWNKYAEQVYPTVQAQPYCGVFVAWVLWRAGVDVRSVMWAPYVPSIVNWARKHGAWKTSGQRDGDLACYDWGGDKLADHVGFSWRDESATGYRAVEGNTSSGQAGSQSNGGGVHVRYRGRRSIMGWVDLDKLVAAAGGSSRPADNGTSGGLVVDGRMGVKSARAVQQVLKGEDSTIAVDGRLGEHSWTAWQAAAGTPADGVISHQSHAATALGNGLVPRAWRHTGPRSKGSTFVRKLQKVIGAAQDGVWGEDTTRRLQRWVNAHPGKLPS